MNPAATATVSRSVRFTSTADGYYHTNVSHLFRPKLLNLSVITGLHEERDAAGYYSYITLPISLFLLKGYVIKSNGQSIIDRNVVIHKDRFTARIYHTPHRLYTFNAKVYHAQSDRGLNTLYGNFTK